jgi:CspA family cold shock protein
MQGTVKWFNQTRGFGFITPEDGGADIFVHYSALVDVGQRTLRDGDKVEYEVIEGQKGPKAARVKIVD